MTQKDRERERSLTLPQLPTFGAASVKNKNKNTNKKKKHTWAAVNYSCRKQSAFPEGFGEYDAVISAHLNSLTSAIKTKIPSANSSLVKSCL